LAGSATLAESVLLLGGTDATIAVAQAILEVGVSLEAVVAIGQTFSISYSADPVVNARSVDIADWGRQRGVRVVPFVGYDRLIDQSRTTMPSLCLVAGWYHMIPRRFRARFTKGCLGFHASLLPQLRGGAPLNWAILADLSETGVTLFEMADGVDDGPIYAQEHLPIGARTQIADLVEASQQACANLVRNNLRGILAGDILPKPQTGVASYGLQRGPEDGRIDWRRSANEIDRLVRAVGRPYPGAFTAFEGNKLFVWSSEPAPTELVFYGAPGQIARTDESLRPYVVTGEGALRLVEARYADGADAMDALLRAGNKRLGR
jgi:methionyl-tRNA formyltransferase